MRKKIIKISIILAIELAIILLTCGLNGVFTENLSAQDTAQYVCDGFFVSGILWLCFAGLSWSSKMGTFDGVGYTFTRWKESILNNKRDWHQKENFGEYKERQAKNKKNKEFSELLIIGGVSLIVASILLLVYNFAF